MKLVHWVNGFWAVALIVLSQGACARQHYDITYLLDFSKTIGEVFVTIKVVQPQLVKSIDFNLQHTQCHDFQGAIIQTSSVHRLVWQPSSKQPDLNYICPIKHPRKSQHGEAFDAWWEDSYAIFRGDDLVPPARVVASKNAESRARMAFKLPKQWPHVNTGWGKAEPERSLSSYNATFEIENPDRKFDRPTGWMIVGDLGTRRDQLGTAHQTQLAVSAPKISRYSRMDALAFMGFVWPQIELAFTPLPPKILIVSADDPLWHGGLSASNSLFLHAQRPMISENATSTLLHEIVHVITRLRANKQDDWIVEGIAEYYSSALLFRAGGITAPRYQKVLANQKKRAGKNKDFRKQKSAFAVKAAAANFFYELNASIRKNTKNTASLDQVVQRLMQKRKIAGSDLIQAVTEVSPNSLVLFNRFEIN